MEELFIPMVVLKSGSATENIFFASNKKDLIKTLNEMEFIQFYAKDEDGNISSEVIIRSDDIDAIELDVAGAVEDEIIKAKESEATVVDITGLLKKINSIKIEPHPNAVTDKTTDKFSELIKHIDGSHWPNIAFRPVAKSLYDLLTDNYTDDETINRLFFVLIGIAMDSADATAFFLGAYDLPHSDEKIAEAITLAIKSWMQNLNMEAPVILSLLRRSENKEYVTDDIFACAIDDIESKNKD